jgi:hypothetical protein
MTVAELIEQLKTLPQDYEVWAYDDDGCRGIADARVVRESILTNHTGKKVHIHGDYFETPRG